MSELYAEGVCHVADAYELGVLFRAHTFLTGSCPDGTFAPGRLDDAHAEAGAEKADTVRGRFARGLRPPEPRTFFGFAP